MSFFDEEFMNALPSQSLQEGHDKLGPKCRLAVSSPPGFLSPVGKCVD